MSDEREDEVSASAAADLRRWLNTYRQDVEALRDVMLDERPPARARELLAGALNYQLQQLDLIPDWVPGVGMVDDAMVLRIAAALFIKQAGADLPVELIEKVAGLANDVDAVRQLIGDDLYGRFEALVLGLPERDVRGRRAASILKHESARDGFLRDLKDDLSDYRPNVGEAAQTQRQLLSYLRTKLR